MTSSRVALMRSSIVVYESGVILNPRFSKVLFTVLVSLPETAPGSVLSRFGMSVPLLAPIVAIIS